MSPHPQEPAFHARLRSPGNRRWMYQFNCWTWTSWSQLLEGWLRNDRHVMRRCCANDGTIGCSKTHLYLRSYHETIKCRVSVTRYTHLSSDIMFFSCVAANKLLLSLAFNCFVCIYWRQYLLQIFAVTSSLKSAKDPICEAEVGAQVSAWLPEFDS